MERDVKNQLNITWSDDFNSHAHVEHDGVTPCKDFMVLSISLDTFYSNKNYATRKI